MPDVTLLGQFHRRRELEKAAGKHLKPIPKARRPKYPWPIEHAYARRLENLVNEMEHVGRPIIEKYLPIIFKEAERVRGGSTRDAWTDDLTAMEDLLRSAYGQLLDDDELEDLVENYASLTSKFNGTDLARVLSVIGGTQLGEELWHEPYVKSFIQQNVSLIKSIGKTNHDQIVEIIHRGVRGGLRHEEVAKQIFGEDGSRFDVSRSKARLIARDQISKFNGDLALQRQRDAGIKKYYWDTAHDERVRGRPDGIYPKARPSHWAQQGKLFDINGPGAPGLGHPGQPIQCRCLPMPYFGED